MEEHGTKNNKIIFLRTGGRAGGAPPFFITRTSCGLIKKMIYIPLLREGHLLASRCGASSDRGSGR